MSFEENLKNFRFVGDDRDVFAACLKFAAFLKKEGVSELQIYLDDAFKFYAAFFGSLLAGATPYVLSKPIFEANLTAVTDENFLNFLENEPAKGLKFTPEAKFCLQTSGSSGKSKMIEKSLSQMIKEGEYLARELKFSPKNTFFSSVSHRHMFGLTFKVFLPLILSARVVAEELNYPEAILGLELADHVFIASPVLLSVLAQNKRALALKPLSGIISAGSRLKEGLRKELGEICSARIIEIYGSTETGVVAKDEGGGLRLFDAVSAGLDEREALNVRSPWCEFFQSNDWASLEGDRLALKGRIDRIVKLNDKRVSLESIEARLLESGLLADCYCAPHPEFKRVAALLQLNDEGLKVFRKIGKKGIADELKGLLRLEFKNNVRYFKIVEKMPRNSQGKFEKCEFESALFASPKPKWNGGAAGENAAVSEAKFDGAYLKKGSTEICAKEVNLRGGAANDVNLKVGVTDLEKSGKFENLANQNGDDFKNLAVGAKGDRSDDADNKSFEKGEILAGYARGEGVPAEADLKIDAQTKSDGDNVKTNESVAGAAVFEIRANNQSSAHANDEGQKDGMVAERPEKPNAAQKYEFNAIMHAGLEIFESHFPNLPLVPGFMLLDFVFELAQRAGIDVSAASGVENLKFMKFVRPGDELRVCFEKRGEKLYFELFCNGEKCSVGRVTF